VKLVYVLNVTLVAPLATLKLNVLTVPLDSLKTITLIINVDVLIILTTIMENVTPHVLLPLTEKDLSVYLVFKDVPDAIMKLTALFAPLATSLIQMEFVSAKTIIAIIKVFVLANVLKVLIMIPNSLNVSLVNLNAPLVTTQALAPLAKQDSLYLTEIVFQLV
jgi:hypothetical protein